MENIDNWIVALCFGAMAVGMYSWVRFDELSCDSKSEYFARYKPRFSTSSKRYWRAKWGYIGAITILFLIVSLVPEIFTVVTGTNAAAEQAKRGEIWLPLATALGLMTLENIPILKDIERKIRAFLHGFARIPDCVRRTVAQMKSSPFNFTPRALAALSRKLNLKTDPNNQPPANLSTLLAEDDLLHTWYIAGALLCALSERNRDRTGIEPLFFEFYKDELDSITDKHTALAELVRQCFSEHSRNDATDASASRQLRDLRDRLFTFIACGVHSSVKADGQCLEIIKRLGFTIRPINARATSYVAQLAGLATAALLVVSAFTGYSTYIFREQFILPTDEAWRAAFPIPTETLGLYAWSCATATFYLAAIMGALAIRNSRVAKREWFDISNLDRERPILRYVTPTLVGTALGCLTLSIIALIGGPAFKPSFGDFGKAAIEAVRQSLPWAPLATVMALISLVLSDSRLGEDKFWCASIAHAAGGAAAMAVVGYITSELSVSTAIEIHRQSLSLGAPPFQVVWVGHYLSLFISAQIGLFAFVLYVIAQVAERYSARARCFAGYWVEVATRHGAEFRMYFDATGAVSLFSCTECDRNAGAVQWRGQWQLFPEGTALRWDVAEGERCKAGEFALISWYGDSLIYEGYVEGFSGTADFVGQVHVRPCSRSSINPLFEAGKIVQSRAPAAPTHPEAPQHALATSACEGANT